VNADSPVTPDAWNQLREATPARIALGRSGGSLPTHEWLEFKAAHAAARDAVHNPFDAESLAAEIAALGVEAVVVDSAAPDRLLYLQRPELGRRLAPASQLRLEALGRTESPPALTIVASDGLSALAAHRQTTAVLAALLPLLSADGWQLSPIVIARFGRVALEDQVGQLLGAQIALMLIGERPGLGSPDSLGAYLVFGPRVGNTDANRNCVSNIRPEGLPPAAAADTIHFLLTEARLRRISGTLLKDERALSAPTATARLTSGE
jgi:ethanolamine ammonia-lyase small subunit